MSPARTIQLVARREIRERVRRRSYRISMAVSMVAVGAFIVIPKLVAGSTHPLRVGVVGTLSPTARTEILALKAVIARNVELVDVADGAAAESELRSRRLAVAVEDSRQVVVRVTPSSSDASAGARLAAGLAAVVGRDNGLRAAGLGDAQIATVDRVPPLAVRGLEPNHSQRDRQKAATLIGVILILVYLQAYGTWVLNGVVEEKSTRVVEVLLAAIRPTALLAGKILGIGCMALLQAVALVAAAFIAAAAVGSHVLGGGVTATTVELVGWFVLGYAFYCSVYGAAGSLISRQEEAQNVAFPLQLPLLLAYFTSFSALTGDRASGLVRVLSFLPPTAPISMPVRLAVEAVPPWQVALSIGLLVAGTAVMLRTAAAVYVRAILHTGQRLTWRQALRIQAA